jgi:hypothetical protein
MTVTIYKSLKEVTNGFQRDVNYVFERIRSGKSQKLIEQIRAEADGEKQQELKKQLPAINFQGVFKERNDKGIKQFSGLIPLDFDKFPDRNEMIAHMDSLKDDEYVHLDDFSDTLSGEVVTKIEYVKHDDIFGEYFEEPLRRVPDISKIKQVIDWNPVKSIDQIILEIASSIGKNGV